MEQCGRDLNSWDKLVQKATDAKTKVSQLVAILREMDQRYPRDNWPAHTTAARTLQATASRNPRDKPSGKIQAQDKPSHSSHGISSRTENAGETPDKKSGKKKKKQRHQYQA